MSDFGSGINEQRQIQNGVQIDRKTVLIRENNVLRALKENFYNEKI
jgi:hypothetical protein